MRIRSWSRTILPLAVALAAVLVATRPMASAQAGSEQRTLFVSALDSKGVPVPDLDTDAFIVKEDGVRREVLRVSPATEPIDITVMVDTSSAATEAITFFRTALPPFLTELARGNSVALVGLADRPTILVRSTSDAKQLAGRAKSLFATPGSGMTLLDAMVETSDGLRKRETATRAAFIAIITDGTEFTNRYSKDVVSSLKKAQVALHLITIGQFFADTDQADRERVFFIAQAPAATGGQQLSMVAPNGLAASLDKVARELASQYKLVYARPQSLVPPDTVEVTSAREGLTVRGTPARSQKGQKGA